MTNKDTKKPVITGNFGEDHSNIGLNTRDIKDDIYNHSNLNKQAISIQEELFPDFYEDNSNDVNTHIFDHWPDMPSELKRVANSFKIGRIYARSSELIASQLDISVRLLYQYVHDLTTRFNIPIASITYGDHRGMFLTKDEYELIAYEAQAKAREEQSKDHRQGVHAGFYTFLPTIKKIQQKLNGQP